MKLVQKVTTILAFSTVILSISGCMNKGMKGSEENDLIAVDNGAILVHTVIIKATVISKDEAKGTVTMASDSGGKLTYKTGEDVALSEIVVGDKVTAVVTEEIAVLVGSDMPDSVAAAGGVMVTPDGVSGTVVSTMNVTGMVTSVNARKHKVTFVLEDGSSKTVKVSKDIDLSLLPVGETVTVQVGSGVALSFEK